MFIVFLGPSWFETEKQAHDLKRAVPAEVVPSVPSGSANVLRCYGCHDEFDEFFHEELEEWHIRPAVIYEDNNFHPKCLEDHKVFISRGNFENGIRT